MFVLSLSLSLSVPGLFLLAVVMFVLSLTLSLSLSVSGLFLLAVVVMFVLSLSLCPRAVLIGGGDVCALSQIQIQIQMCFICMTSILVLQKHLT